MLTVLKFSAQWCFPCKKLSPIYDNVKATTIGVTFKEIDIDVEPDLAVQYKIMSVPTMVFEKDGLEVKRIVGLVKEADITKAISDMR